MAGVETNVAVLREAYHRFGHTRGEGTVPAVREDEAIYFVRPLLDVSYQLALGRLSGSAGAELVNAQEVLAQATTLRTPGDDAGLCNGTSRRVANHPTCRAPGGFYFCRTAC